jgi:hypothetical protein
MGFAKPQDSTELPASTRTEGPSPDAGLTAAQSPEAQSQAAANSIGSLLQRVAGSSMHEIDRLVAELDAMRHLLQTEATRVEGQIIEYAHLSQSAMQMIKVIADNLESRKTVPGGPMTVPDGRKPSSEDDAQLPRSWT